MSRLRLSRRQAIAAAALLLAALVIFMPMRWAVGAAIDRTSNFAASGADGTIWSGRIYEVRLGKLSLGTVNAGVDPLAFVSGRNGFWFGRPATEGLSVFGGRVYRGFGSIAVSDLEGAIPLASLISGLATTQVEFGSVSVSFATGKCRSASGSIRLKSQGGLFAALGIEAGLLGRIRCDAGDLVIPLSSASGMEQLDVRISADGRYRASLQLQQPGAELAPLLSLAGFAPVAGGFRKTDSGRFW
jgi:general secretion pathway protein N